MIHLILSANINTSFIVAVLKSTNLGRKKPEQNILSLLIQRNDAAFLPLAIS